MKDLAAGGTRSCGEVAAKRARRFHAGNARWRGPVAADRTVNASALRVSVHAWPAGGFASAPRMNAGMPRMKAALSFEQGETG